MDRFLKMGSKIGDNRKYVESSFVWNSRGGVNGGERRNLTGRGLLWKKWRRERERGKKNMDGNIAKLVLFQHSVYGDYQCEINSRLEWTPTVVIVRVCVEVRERNFWPKDGIIFWAKEKKRRGREEEERVYLGFHRDASSFELPIQNRVPWHLDELSE